MKAEQKSIRLAMDEAWRDHQHTRDQTWKALQIEFALVVGIIGTIWQSTFLSVTFIGILFVFFVTLCGVQITLRHRNEVELRKFKHILNCEEALGLHTEKLITDVKMPNRITIMDAINPCKGNTALFILRMHLAIMMFALFVLVYRLMS